MTSYDDLNMTSYDDWNMTSYDESNETSANVTSHNEIETHIYSENFKKQGSYEIVHFDDKRAEVC